MMDFAFCSGEDMHMLFGFFFTVVGQHISETRTLNIFEELEHPPCPKTLEAYVSYGPRIVTRQHCNCA